MQFKESNYTGSTKRRIGTPLLRKDPSIPGRYLQISVKANGGFAHTYYVCNNIVHGTLKCDFCIRRETYITNPAKYDAHRCLSMQIERFFQKDEPNEETQTDISLKIVDFFWTEQNPIKRNFLKIIQGFMHLTNRKGENTSGARPKQVAQDNKPNIIYENICCPQHQFV